MLCVRHEYRVLFESARPFRSAKISALLSSFPRCSFYLSLHVRCAFPVYICMFILNHTHDQCRCLASRVMSTQFFCVLGTLWTWFTLYTLNCIMRQGLLLLSSSFFGQKDTFSAVCACDGLSFNLVENGWAVDECCFNFVVRLVQFELSDRISSMPAVSMVCELCACSYW